MHAVPRTVLITGATSGIGLETARRLARFNLNVVLHARIQEEGEEAIEELVKTGSDPLHLSLAVADFTRLDDVRALAEKVLAERPRLDLLINNAATAGPDHRALTGDGHELTLQVNYLAPFLLTRLLWNRLGEAPEGRVINVSSTLHRSGAIHWKDLNFDRRYTPVAAYAQSKLALTMVTKAMAEFNGPTAVAVHPGIVETPLMRIYGRAGSPVREGAVSVVHLASAGAALTNGAYYNRLSPGVSAPAVSDRQAFGRLWKLTARLTSLL